MYMYINVYVCVYAHMYIVYKRAKPRNLNGTIPSLLYRGFYGKRDTESLDYGSCKFCDPT